MSGVRGDAPVVTVDVAVPGARHRRVRPSVVIATSMLSVIVLLALVYPLLPVYDPMGQDLTNVFLDPFKQMDHPLGTDALGRDMLSRVALGIRTSMVIAGAALLLNMAIGVSVGLIAGYFRGFADTLVMGAADLVFSIPVLIIMMMVLAVLGSSAPLLALVIGLTFWVAYARVGRVIALSLRSREYVLAAKTEGASNLWILRKHIWPEVLPVALIMASFDFGVRVVMESSLSYLGLGIQPPTPSLGGMIAEGQGSLQTTPWVAVLPSVAIFFLVGGVQILSQRFTAELRPPDGGWSSRAETVQP